MEVLGSSAPTTGISGGLPASAPEANANRAMELRNELRSLEPKLSRVLERYSTIGIVTREETSVVAANNKAIYEALRQHTESGAIALRPGEYLASPPIPSGLISHPDWSSPMIHSEIQAEYELSNIFDLSGPGAAWSSIPGCGFCVPYLYPLGIIHMNPAPTAPTPWVPE